AAKHKPQVINVILESSGKTKNVIQVWRAALIPETIKDPFHAPLKCSWSFSKGKWKADPLIQAQGCAECSHVS
ncbi:hypothetical protein XENOCAPTIV_017405, partial [Xenoophorus captivus]